MSAAGPGAPPPDVARHIGPWSAAGGGPHPTAPELATAMSSRDRGGAHTGGASSGNVSLVVGGGDPVAQRRRLLGAVGCHPGQGVAMQQIHGGAVAVVGVEDAGRGMLRHADAVGGVDALVTFTPGVALMVMVADCVPVLLHAPGVGVAAVHAGRGGVLAGVVGHAVGALATDPADVEALIGPAIGGCCYEVPPAMAAELERLLPTTARTTRWGTPSIDLPAAVRLQLQRAGVAQVFATGSCTRCDADRWFSHRADPGAGRQAAVVVRHDGVAGSGPPAAADAAADAGVGRLVLRRLPAPQRLTGSATVGS